MSRPFPKIYNIKTHGRVPGAVYCGRGSPYGNPFVIGAWWPEEGRAMTRDDVCNRFDLEVLPRMVVDSLRGRDLLCYCAPERCHCEGLRWKANP